MKSKRLIPIFAITCILILNAFGAQMESSNTTPAMGIQMDSSPLPELLSKHLGLEQGHGIVIDNIQQGSAAEESGLEKDDIILSFKGVNIYDSESLIQAVQDCTVAEEVPLEIIHLGQQKTITLKLKAKDQNAPWKYPVEPEFQQFWQPGRLFRMDPQGNNWTEMLRDDWPDDIQNNINSFFNQNYISQYSSNGKRYFVRIEGDPSDEDTKITVNIDDDEYTTTVKDLDAMPDEYREVAQQVLEDIREKSRFNRFGNNLFQPPGRLWNNFDTQNFSLPYFDSQSFSNNQNEILERLDKQMLQLQERMKELEKSQSLFLRNLEGTTE